MAITPLPHPTPAGVVGAACAEVDALAGSLWAARATGELVAGVEELQRLKAKAAALEAELLAELDVRGTAKRELGWGRRSTGSRTWPARPVVRAVRPWPTPGCSSPNGWPHLMRCAKVRCRPSRRRWWSMRSSGFRSPDPRDHGARMWDGLVQLARHALDTDLPPSHGARPRVAVTVDAETIGGAAAGVG